MIALAKRHCTHRTAIVALVLGLALVTGCKSTRAGSYTEPSMSPAPLADGTTAVDVTIDDRACKDLRTCAEVKAIQTLLFVGVPGSRVPNAMVRNEQQAKELNKSYFADLLEKGGHSRFIVRAVAASATAGKREDATRWSLVVNTEALRKSLEQAGVLRPFGYRL